MPAFTAVGAGGHGRAGARSRRAGLRVRARAGLAQPRLRRRLAAGAAALAAARAAGAVPASAGAPPLPPLPPYFAFC